MWVIKIVKKDAKNVIIHFDDDEVLFLSVDIFYKSGLKKNDEISDDRFSSLIKENQLFHIRQRAFRYLGRRQHSTSELRIKLKQKGYETEYINEVLDNLKQKNYLDDTKFAEMFVEEKMKLKLWGEQKLRSELIKRGIESDIITDVLRNNISEEDKLNNAMIIARTGRPKSVSTSTGAANTARAARTRSACWHSADMTEIALAALIISYCAT